jgi:GntR family transcriptional repressor for pyruvate dehydrogenase complex
MDLETMPDKNTARAAADEGGRNVKEMAESASAVDDLVLRIRTLISDNGLSVGDKLPTERELCARFDTSRNTVREAMRILTAYGLVDVRPKVGATVVDKRLSRAIDLFSFNTLEIGRKTFEDVQGLRALLEVGSVEQLFDMITPEDIADLRELNDRLLAVATIQEAVETDFALHVRLVSVLGNRAMLDVYRIMKPVICRIMETGKTRRTYETTTHDEHEAVIGAIEERDRIAYQYLMKTHLDAGWIHFRNLTGDRRGTDNGVVEEPTARRPDKPPKHN